MALPVCHFITLNVTSHYVCRIVGPFDNVYRWGRRLGGCVAVKEGLLYARRRSRVVVNNPVSNVQGCAR